MTNADILRIAMEQSAIDSSCNAEEFLSDCNKIFISKQSENARRYLTLPFCCDLASYGNNVVASVTDEGDIFQIVQSYIDKYSVSGCFEVPNMHVLNDELQKRGMRVCFMAEYFLPNVTAVTEAVKSKGEITGYITKVLEPDEFVDLYTEDWSNALCEKRKHLDILGVGAYEVHTGKLVGLAACSADCDTMWQIGIDVLKEHRKNGIASMLTSKLALEIINRGKVPFYCAAWSNIKSVRNAIKSGFRPAWVQMTAKPADFVNDMNK